MKEEQKLSPNSIFSSYIYIYRQNKYLFGAKLRSEKEIIKLGLEISNFAINTKDVSR